MGRSSRTLGVVVAAVAGSTIIGALIWATASTRRSSSHAASPLELRALSSQRESRDAEAPDAGPAREPCPKEPTTPEYPTPLSVVSRFGEIYPQLVEDYQDAYAVDVRPVRKLTLEQAERVICELLVRQLDPQATPTDVIEEAQSHGKVPKGVSSKCLTAEKQGCNLGRFQWEFSQLPTGQYLVTRNARTGFPWVCSTSVWTELRDGLVFTTVSEQDWTCPDDPQSLCVGRNISDCERECGTDAGTPCTTRGYSTEVFVFDLASQKHITFGWASERPLPEIAATPTQITVTRGDCVQTAKRPL